MFGLEYVSQSSYNIIAVVTALIVMTIATITDFQKREVADFINYGFFISAIALRILYFGITLNPLIILEGCIGFIITLAIGLIMFYTGQWGGGDTKMIIGIGTLFGLKILPFEGYIIVNSVLISFIINMFVVGSIFGLVWTLVLAIKNWKKFIKSWRIISKNVKNLKLYTLCCALLIIIASFFLKGNTIILIILAVLLLITVYMYIFAKSVEKCSMVRMLPPQKVTEGDWIDKDVYHKGKYITGPKELGITKKQIALLKKYKIKIIPVKIGIPFIPSFLLGFILTLFVGNLITFIFSTLLI